MCQNGKLDINMLICTCVHVYYYMIMHTILLLLLRYYVQEP